MVCNSAPAEYQRADPHSSMRGNLSAPLRFASSLRTFRHIRFPSQGLIMPDTQYFQAPLTTHEEVIERARSIGREHGISRVVVAAAEEDDVLAALHRCREEGIADALLVGQPTRVQAALDLAGVPRGTFELIETSSDEESALRTAEIAGSGGADVVMKGYLKTSTLLKILLKSEHGLRDRELVSHSAVLYVPKYRKLLNITDGGTLIRPTIDQKMTVIANGVQVMRSVGIVKPKVAVLGACDTPRPDQSEDAEIRKLVDLARNNWGEHIDIEGPMTLARATASNQRDGVAGDADILIVNSIEEGNITAKTLIQFGGAIFMGVIAGARVPISLVSRSDTMLNKMASVALAVCLADYQRQGFAPLPAVTVGEVIG